MSNRIIWRIKFTSPYRAELWCKDCRTYQTFLFNKTSEHSIEHICEDGEWEINAPENLRE